MRCEAAKVINKCGFPKFPKEFVGRPAGLRLIADDQHLRIFPELGLVLDLQLFEHAVCVHHELVRAGRMRADEHGLAVAYLQTVEIPDIDLSEAFEAAVLVDFQSTAYEAALIDDLFLKQFLLGSDHVVTRIQYVALRFEIALERSLLLREVAYLRMKPCHLLCLLYTSPSPRDCS